MLIAYYGVFHSHVSLDTPTVFVLCLKCIWKTYTLSIMGDNVWCAIKAN